MRGSTGFKVELKGMDTTDLPAADQEPMDPVNCRVEMTVRVGPEGVDSADDFTLIFVTPAWLAQDLGADEFRVLDYTVVLSRFQWPVAEGAARELVASIEAQSWEEFVAAFSRIAYWELSHEMPPARRPVAGLQPAQRPRPQDAQSRPPC